MNNKLEFPSKEWIEEYCKKLNESAEYNRSASKWKGDFIFVVEKGSNKRIYYMDLWHGTCRKALELNDETEIKAEFILRGNYDVWKQLCIGKLDITKALVNGKIKLKGSLPKLLRNMKGGKVMISVMRDVPTFFNE
jgi:putative sterol carrier protein